MYMRREFGVVLIGAGAAATFNGVQLGVQTYSFRAIVEYEYAGTGTPAEETRKCLEYVKRVLA